MSSWIPVCALAELPPGSQRVVDVDGAQAAVFNLDGELFAIENVCSHDGGTLSGGPIQGECIVCPRHGARFSIRTGAALSAPAYEPVASLAVRIENGVVEVRDERWD